MYLETEHRDDRNSCVVVFTVESKYYCMFVKTLLVVLLVIL